MDNAQDAQLRAAAHTAADQATAVAATLKHGSYEAVKALALVSIAHSLSVLAAERHR